MVPIGRVLSLVSGHARLLPALSSASTLHAKTLAGEEAWHTWKWSILFWVGALLRGYIGARDFTRVLGLQHRRRPTVAHTFSAG